MGHQSCVVASQPPRGKSTPSAAAFPMDSASSSMDSPAVGWRGRTPSNSSPPLIQMDGGSEICGLEWILTRSVVSLFTSRIYRISSFPGKFLISLIYLKIFHFVCGPSQYPLLPAPQPSRPKGAHHFLSRSLHC